MNIDDNLINHLSNLAKLSFEGSNREALKKDLEKIIGFMNQLTQIQVIQLLM
jgi:aspartyl/glutamyl-tRNA(Asn/Gln) amidotransferase C subunit